MVALVGYHYSHDDAIKHNYFKNKYFLGKNANYGSKKRLAADAIISLDVTAINTVTVFY